MLLTHCLLGSPTNSHTMRPDVGCPSDRGRGRFSFKIKWIRLSRNRKPAAELVSLVHLTKRWTRNTEE